MVKQEGYVSVPHAGAKLGSAWLAAIGVNTWSDAASAAAAFASILAAIYTTCLVVEFVWRKWMRPFLERRGMLRRIRRRRDDPQEHRKIGDSDVDA